MPNVVRIGRAVEPTGDLDARGRGLERTDVGRPIRRGEGRALGNAFGARQRHALLSCERTQRIVEGLRAGGAGADDVGEYVVSALAVAAGIGADGDRHADAKPVHRGEVADIGGLARKIELEAVEAIVVGRGVAPVQVGLLLDEAGLLNVATDGAGRKEAAGGPGRLALDDEVKFARHERAGHRDASRSGRGPVVDERRYDGAGTSCARVDGIGVEVDSVGIRAGVPQRALQGRAEVYGYIGRHRLLSIQRPTRQPTAHVDH